MKKLLVLRHCKHCKEDNVMQYVIVKSLVKNKTYFYKLKCVECSKFNTFVAKESSMFVWEVDNEK